MTSPGRTPASAAGLASPPGVSTFESEATSRPSVAASMPTARPTGTRPWASAPSGSAAASAAATNNPANFFIRIPPN